MSDEDGAAPKESGAALGDSLKGWKSMKEGKDRGDLSFSRHMSCETAPEGIFLSFVRVRQSELWKLTCSLGVLIKIA